MIKLSYTNQQIELDLRETASISPTQRIFLRISRFRSHDGVFVTSRRNDLEVLKLIKDVLKQFPPTKYEIATDKGAQSLLDTFREAQRNYNTARIAGSEILQKTQAQDHRSFPTLIRELKDFQRQGVEHLLAVGNGANFSVPGSGKTTVIYAAFDVLRSEGAVDKLVVIGPLSSFRPWEEEFEACFGRLPVAKRLTEAKDARLLAYKEAEKYELFLCSYATAINDIDELIGLCREYKCFVVLDESHYVKKLTDGRRAETVLELAPYASRRAILSGTPAPNDIRDIWTQITFLFPEQYILGSKIQFKNVIEKDPQGNQIKQQISPFCFRVRKSDLHLPEPIYKHYSLSLEPLQTIIYQALAIKILHRFRMPHTGQLLRTEDQLELRLWRRARMVRLLQVASNPVLLTKSSPEFGLDEINADEFDQVSDLIHDYSLTDEVPAKFKFVENLVKDLIVSGEKVIIWTWFVHNIEMMRLRLSEYDPLIIHGGIPRSDEDDIDFNRERAINTFKYDQSSKVLIANPSACAESISLHNAVHHAIYLDRTFNCGEYLQSLDRIHRIGLKADTQVYYHIPMCTNTIDTTVEQRLTLKREKMIRLLEDANLVVGNLDDAENFKVDATIDDDFEATLHDLRTWDNSERTG